MPSFKVSTYFHSHPAVLSASAAAIGLWVRCGAWSAHHLTDGNIPRELVRTWGAEEEAAELVRVGLWRRARGGWTAISAVPAAPGCPALDLWAIERGEHRSKIAPEIRDLVLERDEFRCVGCGATDDLTLDHIHPWSKGGTDTVDNLRVLCRRCNSSKGARV